MWEISFMMGNLIRFHMIPTDQAEFIYIYRSATSFVCSWCLTFIPPCCWVILRNITKTRKNTKSLPNIKYLKRHILQVQILPNCLSETKVVMRPVYHQALEAPSLVSKNFCVFLICIHILTDVSWRGSVTTTICTQTILLKCHPL